MVPNKVVKAKVKAKPYYKLYDDAPTKADKQREAEMIADLEKEDFYGKKKKQESMKVPAFMEKIGKEAINKRIAEESMKVKPKGVIFRSVEIKKK